MSKKTRNKAFVGHVVNSFLKIKDRRTEERDEKREKSF